MSNGRDRPWIAPGVALITLLLVTCVLFAPLIWGALTGSGRSLEWDVPEQYWPDLVYLCEALHDGELPLWNPYDRAGYPYYADPQAGTYQPLNWLLCAFGGASPGLGWAELRVVLGFFMAGAFGLLWLRRLHLPWGPALLGAAVMQTAPFMRHNWELNLTTGLAYLPLMLWAADRAVVRRKYADGVALSLAVALCAWTGSPPALWLASIFTGAYTLVRLVALCRGGERRVWWESVRVLVVALVATAGLTAVVWVPTAQLIGQSVRAGGDFADMARGALALDHLWALVWPRDGNHLYAGLFVLVLAVLSFLRSSLWLLPGRWLFLGMAVAGIWLALGEHGHLFRLAYDWLPGAAGFRLPHRFEAWLGPALGALSAGGLAWLGTPTVGGYLNRRPLVLRSLAGGLMAAGILLAVLGVGFGPAALLLAAGLCGLAVSLPHPGAHHVSCGALLSILLLVDVSQTLDVDRHTVPGPAPGSDASVLQIVPGGPAYRYLDEFGVSCRSGTRHRRRDFRGYQDPLMLKSYERVLASVKEHPGLAEQFNVRYALTGPHFIHGWNRHFLPPPDQLIETHGSTDLGKGVIELPRPLPAAYWVPLSRVERATDRKEALERLKLLAPSEVAILDGATDGARDLAYPQDRVASEGTLPRAARDFSLQRDRLSFRIEAPDQGLAVINEAWYPGWKASVDGNPVPIYRANGLVRAIYVDRGDHLVRMEFDPPDGTSLRWLLLATLIACLAVILGSVLTRSTARRAVNL